MYLDEEKLKLNTINALIQAHYSGKINLAQFKEHGKRICKIYNPEWDSEKLEKHIESILERLERRTS